MQLFAIIASINKEGVSARAREIVISYLNRQLNKNLIEKYIALYDDYVAAFTPYDDKKKRRKKLSSSSVKVLKICDKINSTLHQKEKFIVLIRLLEYIIDDGVITPNEDDFIKTVADIFNISVNEFKNIKSFVINKIEDVPEKEKLVIIDNIPKERTDDDIYKKVKFLHDENLDAKIAILYLDSIETFVFNYFGKFNLNITGRNIIPNRTYVFDNGSIIKGNIISPIYQSAIASYFLASPDKPRVQLHANNIQFLFKNSKNGIQKFNFLIESGQLIGIMGGSGVGKSTLMNVLIGKYKLNQGTIKINGYDIATEKEKLQGLIGYIPQDDLLIEELTVYQNLYYNTKLCFGNYTKKQIDDAVTKMLKELSLYEIKHLKVGSPLKKFISGGQRKRLNIALELIREPAILFIDEPTSGLSSVDSEIVMHLLKHQALQGKLLVVNIHQPSSDIYKLFDTIWIMDKGGHPIYTGNPIDAITYFKQLSNYADAEENECPACGTVHPDEVLEIIEMKMVNEFGKYTQERKLNAKELYTLYKVNLEKKNRFKLHESKELPKTNFKIPNLFNQFKIFTIRDLLSKIADKQYMLINMLEAPALAFILAFFTKYLTDTGEYVFSENQNLPIYLFMTVVVALFMGLSVSAEEIIQDRRILEREKFLNLSKFSYINSKVMIMILLSAVQMFTFVIIGNSILEIRGMTFQFWLILFTTAVSANMIGLNISSALNSVITIYIMIPLILVPQMLLGGAMMKFDDLHDSITRKVYVPVIADIMFSRWAYEAMVVEHYKHNKYDREFFKIEKAKSEALYVSAYLINELDTRLKKCEKGISEPEHEELVKKYFKILSNEISILMKNPVIVKSNIKYDNISKLNIDDFNKEAGEDTHRLLKEIKEVFNARSNHMNELRDNKIRELETKLGKEKLIKLKQDYHNEKVTTAVLDKTQVKQYYETNNRLIRKKDPIYMTPYSNIGRAHFYSPVKKIGNRSIDTFWFNIMFLWLSIFFLYLTLYFSVLKRILDVAGRIKFKIPFFLYPLSAKLKRSKKRIVK